MQSLPPTNDPADLLRFMLVQVMNLSDEEFTGEKRVGTSLSFADQIPVLHEIQAISLRIADLDLKTVPKGMVQTWKDFYGKVYSALHAITAANSVSLTQDGYNAQSGRQRLIQPLSEHWGGFMSMNAATLALMLQLQASRTEEDLSRAIRQANAATAEVKDGFKNILETYDGQLRERSGEIDKALRAAAELSKGAAVKAQAEHFAKLVTHYQIMANWWLVGIGFITLMALFYVFEDIEPGLKEIKDSASPGMIVSHTIPRVLIFSAIYFALAWAAKNMSAANHNAAMNKHRVAALNTLDAFRGATEDDKPTRLAVLIQVTTAIFSPQASGYLKDEPAQDKVPVEIITKLMGGADGKTPP